ncbi:MAG: hypothetical protein CMN01_05305 [Rickettsiales bacterium]|nr:hypothetical protein [Rickettsiales bacterium]|tara:strand:+ start:828 stop:2720 length:1893 start_codon:yes stop_codon:yes gene_type:complete
MLTTLRNSSKNSILKIILGSLLTVLIISFAMWGTEDLVGVTKKQTTVASVGNLDVSSREFYSLYSRQTEEIRKLLGSSLSIEKSREFGYVDRALSSLINRALFNNEALELGLSVSDTNVRDRILKDDSFKDDLGQFSELVFRQLISESGYTEDSYVEGTRQDLAREQMVETIRTSLKIPNIMKKNLAEYNLQERSVDFLVIDAKKEIIPKVNEIEIKEFYNKNQDKFMTDEYRSVETLLLDAKEYAEKLTVTEDEVKLLYEERKELLIEPEQRYLRQILVDEEKIARDIYKKLNKKVNNFDKIAENSANLSREDTDLGWNTKNELPEEIVDAVFKLSKDKVTSPIKSSFGWHVIVVDDIKKKKETSYSEIKERFQNELLFEKGKDAVFDLQDDLEDLLASGNTFSEISDILDVQLITAKSINRQGIDDKMKKNDNFQDERILRSIFNQKLNEEGNIIDIDKDEGLAISIVNEIIEPRKMTFEEAMDLAREKLILEKKIESAKQKAEKIVKMVSDGKKFNKVASQYSLELKGNKPFKRILPDNSELPIPLISKIFDSKLGDVNYEQRGGSEFVVAQTAQIINTIENTENELKEFSDKIREDLSLDLLAQFSEALRKKYKITINDSVIDQLN